MNTITLEIRGDLLNKLTELPLNNISEELLRRTNTFRLPVVLEREIAYLRLISEATPESSDERYDELLLSKPAGYTMLELGRSGAYLILLMTSQELDREKLVEGLTEELNLLATTLVDLEELKGDRLQEAVEELKLLILALLKLPEVLHDPLRKALLNLLKSSAEVLVGNLNLSSMDLPPTMRKLMDSLTTSVDSLSTVDSLLDEVDTPEEKAALLLALTGLTGSEGKYARFKEVVERALKKIASVPERDDLLGKLLRRSPELMALSERAKTILDEESKFKATLEKLRRNLIKSYEELSEVSDELSAKVKSMNFAQLMNLVELWDSLPEEVRLKLTDIVAERLTELLMSNSPKLLKSELKSYLGTLLVYLQDSLPNLYDEYMEMLAANLDSFIRGGDYEALITAIRGIKGDYQLRKLYRKLVERLRDEELTPELKLELAIVGFKAFGRGFLDRGFHSQLNLSPEQLLYAAAIVSPRYYNDLRSSLGELSPDKLASAYLRGNHLRELLDVLPEVSASAQRELMPRIVSAVMQLEDELLTFKVVRFLLDMGGEALDVDDVFYLVRKSAELDIDRASYMSKKIGEPLIKAAATLGCLSVADEELMIG